VSFTAAVYGKSAAEDLEDQLRFEEGDDDVPHALAHDPLTLISQPSPPLVVPPPPTAPPPAVPAPQLVAAAVEDAGARPAPVTTGTSTLPAGGGVETVQPQPATILQADTATAAAEPAALLTAEQTAAADAQQQSTATVAASAAAADTKSAATQQPAVTRPVADAAPATAVGKPPYPEIVWHGTPSDSSASAVPDGGRTLQDRTAASSTGNASAIVAPAAAAVIPAAVSAGPAAPLVPQIVPVRQMPPEPRLLTLDADDKQLQLQLQSSRLGKSVYDLLVQVQSEFGRVLKATLSNCHLPCHLLCFP
jgi:hypothetical protein